MFSLVTGLISFRTFLISSLKSPEREIKFVRPLYSVEVTETETAKFETEISESDIHATWKLKGETLHSSAVRLKSDTLTWFIGPTIF